jgi:hypothetical protein
LRQKWNPLAIGSEVARFEWGKAFARTADLTFSHSLDPKQMDSEKVLALAREKTVPVLEHYPVSAQVNNAKNQSAELIEPFENRAWLVTIIRSADCPISRSGGHLTQDSLPLSVATH